MNRVLFALIRNDLRLFFSDRRAVMITILVPVMVASFFATILGGGGSSKDRAAIPVAVADNDHSATSEEIITNLGKDGTLQVNRVTEAEARAQVARGKTPVALLLPAHLEQEGSRSLFAGADAKRPEIALLYDPSHNSEYQMVRGLAMQQVMQVVSRRAFSAETAGANADEQLQALRTSTTVPAADRAALTDLLHSVKRYYGRPKPTTDASISASSGDTAGAMRMPVTITDTAVSGKSDANNATVAHAFAGMAVQGVLFFAIDAAMGILRDRRTGIWKRLRAAPISRGALLGGKVLSTSLIAVTILSIVFGVGGLVFHIRIGGSTLGFALLLVCTALMVAAFGLMVSALGKTEAQSRAYAVPAVLGMSLLGGAWFPAFLMPRWIQGVSMLVPSRWAVDGFDAMTWRGFGIASALTPCLALLGFAAVFGLIAAFRFRWDAE